MKNIYFIVLSIVIMIYILRSVRRNKLSVSTSFVWIMASLLMLFLAIFPKSLDWISKLLGISYPPALFLTLCVVILVVADFNSSKKMAEMNDKIIDLAQELTVLKGEKNKNDK